MRAVETRQGNSPVILGLPHTGTDVPDDIWSRLNDNGKILADTDWHIHKLYDGLSIWKDGEAPTEADIADRIARFHRPYHDALAAEIERVKAIHGVAILYDCHSIRSHIPFLFEGKLPDFNIGTDMGKTCDPGIEAAAVEVTAKAKGYTSILNGRFKGGWTTRHYGRSQTGVHAIQMELAQSTHLATEAVPFAYDEAKADTLRVHLKTLLQRLETIAAELKS